MMNDLHVTQKPVEADSDSDSDSDAESVVVEVEGMKFLFSSYRYKL